MSINILSALLSISVFTIYSNAFSSPYEYCFENTATGISARSIPARKVANKTMDLNMTQVHLILRHGARVPGSMAGSTCFETMKENPIEWDCIYTETFQGSTNEQGTPRLHTQSFQKVFDTNVDDNFFGGTCEKGQLTADAIPQMTNIANIIHENYFNESTTKLFTLDDFYKNPHKFYFRSTFYQRTMHSGALMFSQLFSRMSETDGTPVKDDFIMDVHLIDEGRDPMRNTDIGCPEFNDISWEFINSEENKAMFEKNKDIHDTLESLWGKDVPTFWYWDAIDCFCSMVCKDKQQYLPAIYQVTHDSNETNSGVALYNAIEEEHALYVRWNNSQLSKCATQDFYYDFKQGFNVRNKEQYGINDTRHDTSRNATFLLYSAHDSTMMYFVGSMDDVYDGKWPGYGSTFYVEVYDNPETENSYFRVIYNGNDRTDKIKGCAESEVFMTDGVCEMSHLMESMSWVTKTELPRPGDDTYPRPITDPNAVETTAGINWAMVAICGVVGVIAGFIAHFTCSFCRTKRIY